MSDFDNKKLIQRIGFMQGQGAILDDIHWDDNEVAELFFQSDTKPFTNPLPTLNETELLPSKTQ